MVHSIHVSRHTACWVQAQVGFGRVYFPGPNRVGARAHFMRWAQPILRMSRRDCVRANDGLASVNAGQPLMKNLSHFVKSVLYMMHIPPLNIDRIKHITTKQIYPNISIHGNILRTFVLYFLMQNITEMLWKCSHDKSKLEIGNFETIFLLTANIINKNKKGILKRRLLRFKI